MILPWDNSILGCSPTKVTLPTIYNQALSYYEVILMLANRVEETVKLIDEFEDKSKEYTDTQIGILRNSLTIQLQNTVNELNEKYEEFTAQTGNTIQGMQEAISTFNRRLTDEITSVNARTDLAISQNNEYLLDKIAEGLIDIRVINYFTGNKVTIQEMFDYLSEFHLENAITYSVLANRNNTYSQLARLNISYTELALNGAVLIPQR